MKEILKERTKCNELQIEANIEKKIKIRDIYGPLVNMWQSLEGLIAATDETVNVDMESLVSCTQQTTLLLRIPQLPLNTKINHRTDIASSSFLPNTECEIVLKEISLAVDICLGKNSEHMVQKTERQKVKRWIF